DERRNRCAHSRSRRWRCRRADSFSVAKRQYQRFSNFVNADGCGEPEEWIALRQCSQRELSERRNTWTVWDFFVFEQRSIQRGKLSRKRIQRTSDGDRDTTRRYIRRGDR